MTAPNLLELLVKIIRLNPGCTVQEVRTHLRKQERLHATRHEVNSLLYSNRNLFLRDDGYVPRWSCRQTTTEAVRPRPVRRPAAPTSIIRSGLYGWQREALASWESAGGVGVVEAVTGAGKTRVGLAAAAEELARGGKVLVLVPTLELLGQWHDELVECAPRARVNRLGGGRRANFRTSDVIVATSNSARDRDVFPPRGEGLLIADECHRNGSARNKDALDERFPRRLGLSATYARNDEGNAEFLDPYFGGVCFHLGYRRALRDGVIAHFSAALVGVRFSEGERAEYDNYSEDYHRLRTELIRKHGVTEEPFGEFMKEVQSLKEGGNERVNWAARMFLNAFSKRRKLLAETPAKLDGLRRLAEAIRSANRTLVFTETVECAEGAAQVLRRMSISAGVVHSGMRQDERKAVLEMFGSGHLHVVVAPKVLDEGVDVPEADLAVIVAASKTRRQMIQRMGRVLRVKRDGRMARFALLYVEGTSEDPELGAHAEFVEEITDVADRVETFDSTVNASRLSKFLCELYHQPKLRRRASN